MEASTSKGIKRRPQDAVLMDIPSGSPPKQKRGRRTAPKKSASDEPETEPRALKPRASKRGRSHAAVMDDSEASTNEVVELPSGWNGLPHILLITIYGWLPNEDVISAGQSCHGWREAAKLPTVWMKRSLTYDVPDSAGEVLLDRHEGARAFARTMRFAPNLLFVSCAKSMKPAARTAMSTKPICKVKSAVLNGRLKWTVKYLERQRESLEGLTFFRPTAGIIQVAMALPKLTSLMTTDCDYSYTPDLLKNINSFHKEPGISAGFATGSLKRLTCHLGVFPAACTSLVQANEATLEEVVVYCFPAQALERCAQLRRLLVSINPYDASDKAKLRQLLQARAPLDFVGFIGTFPHAKAPCADLRASLKDYVRGGAIWCDSCNMSCPKRRPRSAPRDLRPDAAFDDIVAREFNVGDPCHCSSCSDDGVLSDDDSSDSFDLSNDDSFELSSDDSFDLSNEDSFDLSNDDSFDENPFAGDSSDDSDGPGGCYPQ